MVLGLYFPVFEILRPIPPIAWVPISIIFWPTQELSIAFVIFLGAFYTVTLSTMNGAREIDVAVLQSAISMGASRWSLFRNIVLPATLPSIITGAAVGMGITWGKSWSPPEMISGGGQGSQAGGGFSGPADVERLYFGESQHHRRRDDVDRDRRVSCRVRCFG